MHAETPTVPNWVLGAALIAGLVAAAFFFRGAAALPQTPQEAVDSLFAAAARGDDDAYLRLLTGELYNSLASSRSQSGVATFRENLRRQAAGIKGYAVSRLDGASEESVALDVDIVYVDRKERQQMLCVQKDGGWQIARLSTSESTRPAVPYGTPVFEEPAAKPKPGRGAEEE